MNLIEARNVNKRFINHQALQDVSITVPKQSVFGLLGPNGAGKTTLIRIINKITAPDEGEVLFMGKPLRREHLERIGYLPEERGLYKKMKAGEQALYLARLKGMDKADAHRKLKIWFEKFGISTWWNNKVEELSKGMQQKIQFIVTVVHEPELLIFDEPFSGFDPINVNLLKKEILKLRERGATIIFSTHNMSSVEELCDRITLINKSRTILEGEMEKIKRSHRSNTFEVEYSGSAGIRHAIDPNFEILSDTDHDGHRVARIRLDKQLDTNKLVHQLLPHVTVHSFREMLPSMNDIFISKVQEDVS